MFKKMYSKDQTALNGELNREKFSQFGVIRSIVVFQLHDQCKVFVKLFGISSTISRRLDTHLSTPNIFALIEEAGIV